MTSTTQPRRKATKKKLLATAGVLAGVTAIAGMGAYALFTDSGTATTTVDAGQLDIVMSESYTVADIAPGDTIQRPVTITLPQATNDGELISAVRFYQDITTDTIGTDDPLLSGPGESLVGGTDGLTYRLVTCEGGTWSTLTTPAGPYTCSGTEKVTDSGKLSAIEGVGAAVDLLPGDFGVTETATGTFPTDTGDVALSTMLEFVLPTTADNDYENALATMTFTGAAIQRGGIQK